MNDFLEGVGNYYNFSIVCGDENIKECRIGSPCGMTLTEAWSLFRDHFNGSHSMKLKGYRDRNKSYTVACSMVIKNGQLLPVDVKYFKKLKAISQMLNYNKTSLENKERR